MCDRYMSADPADVSISEARERLADVVDRARELHRPVFLSRRGRRVAAVVDADDLERLLELAEDMADIRAADEARHEMRATGELPVPWDEV
jgi:prevent-host-death family protein